MNFSNVARYFDREPVYDAYTGVELFKCQFSTFNDSQSSGATSRRRVMSAAPGATIPARRALKIFNDEVWIAGSSDTDGFMGSAVRGNYNLKKASGLYTILTPAEACLEAVGTTAYAQFSYFKDTIDTTTTSEVDPFWNAFFSYTDAVGRGKFIRKDSTLYRVRSGYLTDDRYQLAQCDELDAGSLRSVVFTSLGAYDLATDSYVTATVTTNCIAMDMQKFYRLRTQAETYERPGDLSVFVAKSVLTPKVGATATMGGEVWAVTTVNDELDAWVLQLRRA